LQDGKRDMNCFTTHLGKQGDDLRYIQKILGHRSSKTLIHFFKTTGQATEIYTHITSEAIWNIKSPLDNLEIEKEKSET
jgi:site-specific recombinase XerD